MAKNNNEVKNKIVVHNPDGFEFDRPRAIEVQLCIDQFYSHMVKELKFDMLNHSGSYSPKLASLLLV